MRKLMFVPTLLMMFFIASACENKGEKASTSSVANTTRQFGNKVN